MCGILAVIGDRAAHAPATLSEALDLLRHRGPDDRGEWRDADCWLGHRRLAIIDVSPAGSQPMVDGDTGVVVTFNGEIFNFVELRSELEGLGHRFRSHSDTEVLLRSYLQWGTACVERFNGMWAFVIWDPRSREAFLSRDRLGIKPLYFAVANGGLVVASEPKAILHLRPALRNVDEGALYAFLAEGELYTGARTFYTGLRALEAAHIARFRPGDAAPTTKRFWTIPACDHADAPDFAAALTRFGELLDDSVRLRMRSDVPVGITLSGGLDSSAVLAAAVRAIGPQRPLHAFTSAYDTGSAGGVDERPWARRAAASFGNVELEEVVATRDQWLTALGDITWHMDGPGYSPAVFPLSRIMQRAQGRGVRVLLEGQGADELLGGYPQHAAVALHDRLARADVRGFWREYPRLARSFTARALALWIARESLPSLQQVYRRQLGALGVLRPDFVRAHRGPSNAPPTPLNRRLRDDVARAILPGLLQYGDAISMAYSVEARLPFLDHRLVELVAPLPAAYKVGDGESKRILRAYLRAVDLHAIAARRDKQGYPTPVYAWLSADGGAMAKTTLLARDAQILRYCTRARVERLIQLHVAGRTGASNHVYRLLATEVWLRGLRVARARPPMPSTAAVEAR